MCTFTLGVVTHCDSFRFVIGMGGLKNVKSIFNDATFFNTAEHRTHAWRVFRYGSKWKCSINNMRHIHTFFVFVCVIFSDDCIYVIHFPHLLLKRKGDRRIYLSVLFITPRRV